jgi:hypothetical protein
MENYFLARSDELLSLTMPVGEKSIVTMNAVAIRDIRQLGPVHSNKCCQSPNRNRLGPHSVDNGIIREIVDLN